jgi:hypothetical protein
MISIYISVNPYIFSMLYIYIYSVHSKKSQYYDKFVYKWAKYALYCNIYKSKKFIRVLKDFTIFFVF